jgi:hypothetical protein
MDITINNLPTPSATIDGERSSEKGRPVHKTPLFQLQEESLSSEQLTKLKTGQKTHMKNAEYTRPKYSRSVISSVKKYAGPEYSTYRRKIEDSFKMDELKQLANGAARTKDPLLKVKKEKEMNDHISELKLLSQSRPSRKKCHGECSASAIKLGTSKL